MARGFYGVNRQRIGSCRKVEHKLIYTGAYSLLCTHQRLATSGRDDLVSNSHPHETKNLVIIHNGVFSGLGDQKKSDSRIFAEMLEKAFIKSKRDIVKAVNKVHEKVTGTFSIMVVDKKTNKLYYYKNSSTDMFFADGNTALIMSTLKDNVRYGKAFFSMKGKIKEVKANKIYDIIDDFKLVGKLKVKEPQYMSGWVKQGKSNDYIYMTKKKAKKKKWDNISREPPFNTDVYYYNGRKHETDREGRLWVDDILVDDEYRYWNTGELYGR